MRLLVSCTSGNVHSLYVGGPTKVGDVKRALESLEGVSAERQSLLFAGKTLEDHQCLIEDYRIEDYSLSDEVMVYMYPTLASSRIIFLAGLSSVDKTITEAVEDSSSLIDVKKLLRSHGLAGDFVSEMEATESGCVVVRRTDGTTVQTVAHSSDSLVDLDRKIMLAEAFSPRQYLFYQARDGCLHVLCGPGLFERSESGYTVYCRCAVPQQPIMQNLNDGSVPLKQLVRDLCVLP